MVIGSQKWFSPEITHATCPRQWRMKGVDWDTARGLQHLGAPHP